MLIHRFCVCWRSPLLKNPFHFACIWLTALCVFVQSVGAAVGGVLCLGCTDVPGSWGGISVTSAPCTPVFDCCAQPEVQHKSHLDGRVSEDDPDSKGCECFDITLKSHDGARACPQSKILHSFSHFLVPAAAIPAARDVSLDRAMWPPGARAGPLFVRLLVPLSRRTVLLN